MKTVCIIGGGPSGLVAAKTLTHSHPGAFHVTVFEALPRTGGLWPQSQNDVDGLVNPEMCTNQSRHTVSFSDLAWEQDALVFPKAWQVGRYLERYVKMYAGYEIQTSARVVKAEVVGERWKIYVRRGEKVEEEVFDHVIVSTGFFGKPKLPSFMSALSEKDFVVPVWHSSRFRDVKALLTNNGSFEPKGKRIVVVGGQMSGVEVAANVALQLSSAVNSPGESSIKGLEEIEVVHVVQKPFWVLPLFLPNNPVVDGAGETKINNPAPSFLPCDLVTYNLSARPPGELQSNGGHIPVETAEATHGFLNTYIGSDQSELGYPELSMTGPLRSDPPFLAVSDEYTEFVRSGKIKIVRGHSQEVSPSREIVIKDDIANKEYRLTDVAAVILATGFDSTPSLDFLQPKLLETLQFDPETPEFPLALNVHTAVNRELPSLGFVGFYRSPYWGVMEMQARYLGKLWSGDERARKALDEDTTRDTMLKLRRDPRQGQFPMGDYAYLMEDFSKILGIKRQEPDESQEARTGLVFPPRYTYSSAPELEKIETGKAIKIFNDTFSDSEKKGKFLARAVFRALQGDWKLERKIESFIATYPSGTFNATAKFLPRKPTEDGYDGEYLYVENGEFTTTTGMKFSAKRSYAHRYAASTDKLSSWFIKQDDKTIDYFFHELEFVIPSPDTSKPEDKTTSGAKSWKAKAFHLCTPDTYDVEYEFKFKGVQLEEWIMAYTVKGPQKDYWLRSVYRR